MLGRTFSREFKLDVVREIEEGRKRPAQACREYQLAV
jgi:transposase